VKVAQYEVLGGRSFQANRPGRDDRLLRGRKSHLRFKNPPFSIVLAGRRRWLSVSRHFVPGYFQMSLRDRALAAANIKESCLKLTRMGAAVGPLLLLAPEYAEWSRRNVRSSFSCEPHDGDCGFWRFNAHNPGDVLSSHRAGELIGQSPLPLRVQAAEVFRSVFSAPPHAMS
jgi:hypothetical protein